MADETTESVIEGVTADTSTTVTEPKKQRAARASKAAAPSSGVEVTSDATASVPGGKRRKQTRVTKAKPVAGEAKTVRQARQPRVSTVAAPDVSAAPVAAADEMADLLLLEEENQRLRKLLAEKLRAENAVLRKRLGVS